MTRYRRVVLSNGNAFDIGFTPEEEAARDAEETAEATARTAKANAKASETTRLNDFFDDADFMDLLADLRTATTAQIENKLNAVYTNEAATVAGAKTASGKVDLRVVKLLVYLLARIEGRVA